jgi:uncharacterized protein with NAD-binding domain and iron-sulfur cluster
MTSVTIVGGGLAGLVAGIRLAERGCKVTLFEASHRLGGKAGAQLQHGQADEHGYHIFPAWYRNVWRLVDELGLRDRFVDCLHFQQLRAGEFPRFTSFSNITSVRYAWKNLTSGVLPVPQAFLFFYAALDLMSQPYRYRARLDQVTVSGFLRSRFYRTEAVSLQFEELMLKGISVPTYEVSAMTMRNVMRYWVRYPEPMHRILRGDLQTQWIDPLEARLRKLGGEIHLGHRLERLELEGGRIAALSFTAGGGERRVPVERVLLAIPGEKAARLVGDELFRAAPSLGQLRYLRARPMAALNVYLKKRIPGLPGDHVNLLDSPYGISFIDVAQTWPGYEGHALNAIASDFTALEGLSPELVTQALLDEMRRYLPGLEPENIVRTDLQTHLEEPLFMNNVGGWTFRPEARSALPNLYFAGDFCRSAIDLVSMEGAVSTGLLAAEAIRKEAGLEQAVEVLVPETPPHWLLAAGKLALLPVAALAWAWAWLDSLDREPPPDRPREVDAPVSRPLP